MSGGIEHRFIEQVFNKSALEIIEDLSSVTGEKHQDIKNKSPVSEDDKLVDAIINEG
jgi:hypothetical protein